MVPDRKSLGDRDHRHSAGLRGAIVSLVFILASLSVGGASFTPLEPLPRPKVLRSSPDFPGGGFSISNLFDGDPRTDYSSAGNGTNTFVELTFGQPVRIAAMRHIERSDPATVASSELTFMDASGAVLKTVPVKHANVRSGDTLFVLPAPVEASRVKWRVAALGPARHATVGGAELSFYAAGKMEPFPARIEIHARAVPYMQRGNPPTQPIQAVIDYNYAEPAEAVAHIAGGPSKTLRLKPGVNRVEWELPTVKSRQTAVVGLDIGGKSAAKTRLRQEPIRPMTVYMLPHSHTDIGYTEIQTAIEKKQVNNLIEGMAAAKRTTTYPQGSRFVWNVEVLWAADLYMRRLGEAQRADFLRAVKEGQVALNGMYLNELTGLCRPEELIRLFRCATQFSEQTGVKIESAMISDVPGYTWGTVTAMGQAGIRYFSVAPNYFDRIGTILREWENKPFWWLGPDGKTRVLVWIPYLGYAMSGFYHSDPARFVDALYDNMAKHEYPYDIAYVRWSGFGDNAVPDTAIAEFVRDWNGKYEWPRLIISGTTEAFRAFEQRYGGRLPVARGDWTPYWEDGAGSSALETAMNRQSSDRLAQAETLFAMRKSAQYPAERFADAWRNVILYSEHTWGADVSIGKPESQKTREQWEIKRGYAEKADQQSRELLAQALDGENTSGGAIDVFNTLSWKRSELVVVPRDLSGGANQALDDHGQPVASQKLVSGELVFAASDVPPFAGRRYTLTQGGAAARSEVEANAETGVLDNGIVSVRIDLNTGGLAELLFDGRNFADTSGGESLNDYLYLPGDDLKDVKRNGAVKITVGESGPLVASLNVESDAPGCRKLRREIRLSAGRDYVELLNLVDKERLQAASYHAREGKESVNFAFPFNVPSGEVRMDIPFGVIRPDRDQLPSACKDWFTVGRWIDVANRNRGVTLVTLDAPLMQMGGLTARLLNSQTNPDVWRKRVEKTQKVYAWVMNNHWGTNYRAYQEGPTLFRFILRPHGRPSPAENTRFATAFTQPLLAARSSGNAPPQSLLLVSGDDVVVTGLKPSDDGRAIIARLFGAGDSDRTTLQWRAQPMVTWVSDTSESPGEKVNGPIMVPASGLITVRAQFK